jgi:hypothetical protein
MAAHRSIRVTVTAGFVAAQFWFISALRRAWRGVGPRPLCPLRAMGVPSPVDTLTAGVGDSQVLQVPLRSILRHRLQSLSGGRPDKKSPPIRRAFHGYAEQLRHQCHVSLSAARTYTGIAHTSLCEPLHRFFPARLGVNVRDVLAVRVLRPAPFPSRTAKRPGPKAEALASVVRCGLPARCRSRAPAARCGDRHCQAGRNEGGQREGGSARAAHRHRCSSHTFRVAASGLPVHHCFAPPVSATRCPSGRSAARASLSPLPCLGLGTCLGAPGALGGRAGGVAACR